MKVGVFTTSIPQHVGGAFTFTSQLLKVFLARAHESPHQFVVLSDAESIKNLKAASLAANIETGVYNSGKEFSQRWIPASDLASFVYHRLGFRPLLDKVCEKHGIDFLWHLAPTRISTQAPHMGIVWDVQHLTHPWFPEVSARGDWYGRDFRDRSFLRRASLIITGTEAGKEELMCFFGIPAHRIKILPHPTPIFADDAVAYADVARKYELTEGYYLYPAQLWAHKNHMNLILACQELVRRGESNLQMLCVGSDKGNLQFLQGKVNELGLKKHVRFLGFVPTGELVTLYRNARAMVYASFSGPENLPPLEAFSLGCPAVASDFPGAREQLADAALFFDPLRPQSIADAMLKIKNEDPACGLDFPGQGPCGEMAVRGFRQGCVRHPRRIRSLSPMLVTTAPRATKNPWIKSGQGTSLGQFYCAWQLWMPFTDSNLGGMLSRAPLENRERAIPTSKAWCRPRLNFGRLQNIYNQTRISRRSFMP